MNAAYDRVRLAELFGGDAAALAEIEHDFLETARIAEREICATDDLAVIARAAHRLRGAAGMVGAQALGRLAGDVERAAKADDLAAVRRLHAALGQEVHRVAELTRS